MFQNRRLLIATKHDKQRVIAPLLEKELGVVCFVDEDFDTDALGTFTGEVERELDPVSAAREKCRRGMERTSCDLAVASEGSFGPHPSLFFVNADDEFLVLLDARNNLEIVVREVSTSTNFAGRELASHDELLEFVEQAGFPEHGIILRKAQHERADIFKGLTDKAALLRAFDYLMEKYGAAYAETDMRASFNPTRMRVIESATQKLVEKIKSTCPRCGTPGFGITDAQRGLPCSLCGTPTRSVLSYVYQCQHCGFRKEDQYPGNKTTEYPMYCDSCNP